MAFAQSKTQTGSTLTLASGGGTVSTVSAGSTVTLTATVKAGTTAVSPGQVNFCDANTTYCTDVHVLGTAQLTSAGTAVIKFRPGVGTHNYKAVFLGTNTYATSSSSAAALTVTGTSTPFATTTTIAGTGSWGNYTLTGTVAEVGGTAPLTGSVFFLDTSNANAVLGTAALGTSAPGLTWLSSQTPSSGFGPESVVSADFNGDGIPDLAVASSRDSTLKILLGNGDGTFGSAVSSMTVNSPGSMVVADFNGDGIPDLAVANGTTVGGVTVLLGKGDGTFTQVYASPTVGADAWSITVADFNGDGIPDMAVSSPFSGVISILLGKGDGTFTSTQMTLANSGCVSDIASGDFNGDGKADLVVTGNCEYDQGNSVIILLGNGDGTFTTGSMPQTGHDVGSVVVADFNGDGKPDLAVANSDGSAILTILLGNGDGTFTLVDIGPSIPTHPATIALGDFDGDGIVDLALPNVYNNTVTIYQGNGDGRDDIATTNYFDSTVTVLLAEATMTATSAPTAVAPAAPGQHLLDASYMGSSNYTSSVSGTTGLWGVPPVTTTTLAITSGGSPVTNVAAGSAVTLTATVKVGSHPLTIGQINFCDATATACTDIHLIGSASLTSNGTASFKYIPGPGQQSYKAVLLENGYAATSSSPVATLTVSAPAHVNAPTTTTIAATGNIGNYTLTATVVGTGSNSSLTGNVSFLDTSYSNSVLATAELGSSTAGLAWPASSIPFTNVGFMMIAVGDFNGDGILDIATVNTNTMTITILLGNGDGTFKTTAGPTLSTYTTAVVAGDFNGDGKLDLAVSSVGSGYTEPGSLTIFLGNGDGTFTAAPDAPAVGNYAKVFAAADFNGDGKLDLVINEGWNTRILLGNGDGTFSQGPATGLSATMAVADLNGDGIPDLIVGPYSNSSAFAVYLGKGDGTFQAAGSPLSAASQPGSAVVGDFNGDGIPDVAITGAYYSSVTVFLGKGDGTFTSVAGSSNPSINEPGSIAAADFNYDGKLDLVITNWNSYSGNSQNPDLTFLLGNGDGTFTAIPGDTQLSATWSVIAADFNGDGVPDVAVGTASGVSALVTEPTQTATATATGVSPSGPAPHLVDASYPGDSNYNFSASATTPLDVQVATPVFTPAAGTYTSTQAVTITDATPGATIYYAITSTWPYTFTVYSSPITINTEGGVNFQAYATEAGYEQSATTSAYYDLNLPPAPTPVISPAAGSYAGPQSVTVTDTATSTSIYYTTDGSLPTTASTKYTAPFTVSASAIVIAIATAGGYNTSAYGSAQFTIDSAKSSFIYTVAGDGSFGYAGDGGPATAAMLNAPGMTVLDSAGNLYIADAGNSVVRRVDAKTGIVATVAGTGMPGSSGDNGPATSAQLGWPAGLALDRSGNLYVSDYDYGVVREVSKATGIITTVAGNPTATALGDNGPATSAVLTDPAGLALDSSGNLYIATSTRIREVNANTGTITTFAGNGTYGSTGDNGPATSASLEAPFGLAIDNAGNLYIADAYADVVRKVTAGTNVISTVAGEGYVYNVTSIGDGGPATSAFLNNPYGVAVDVSGNLFIADTGNYELREVTASNGIINRLIGTSTSNCYSLSGDGGPAGSSGICSPRGVTIDAAGDLYIAETGASRVREMTSAALPPTSATSAPTFNVPAGTYASPQTVTISSSTAGAAIHVTLDGSAPTATGAGYQGPINVTGSVTLKALAVAPGYLPSAPVTATYTISMPPTSVINTVAGSGFYGPAVPGAPATSEPFGYLTGVGVDSAGNLYIPDDGNEVVWMVSVTTGNANIVAGTLGSWGEAGDGGPATSALLSSPSHVAVDSVGNLYIAETASGRIRMVAAGTGIISTYAGGGGNPGNLGDNGPATSAYLSNPEGIAADTAGNLYIADSYDRRIRKVSPAGIITTVAGGGTGAGLGDGGPATSAFLYLPTDVAVDAAGNLYIVDTDSGRVRMVIAQTGNISTLAGNGNFGSSGDGALATHAELYPLAVTVDGSGKVYIANGPNTVRMVDQATKLISTVAGSGYWGFSGDGGSATLAELSEPTGLAAGKSGSVYIVDSWNSRIRELTYPGPAPTPAFSLAAGTYTAVQSLTITDTIQGAAIYYTTDGSTPTPASSVYSGAITISSSETVQAIAVASGYTESAVESAAYVIVGPASTPTFSPGGGTYTSVQTITIADATQGATIYFTMDGSTPTTNSNVYSGPISVSSSETLEAIATASGYTTSAVGTAAYTLHIPPGNPVPVLTSLSPALTSAGSGGLTLTANGSGFVSASTLYWGATALATQYVNGTSLTAQLPSASVTNAGTTSITVETPSPGGGTSNALQFEVDTAGSTPPSFTTVTASVTAGSTATYPVTLPSSATNVSVTCLNLPSGATCSYSASSGAVTIATAASTPAGTYQVTIVFTETLPGAASGWILLPLMLLPLMAARRKARLTGIWFIAPFGLAMALAAAGAGCGGGGGSTPVQNPTHQATSSGVVTLTVH